MAVKLKHYRIELHTADPKGYEAFEKLAREIRERCEPHIEGGTPGFGVYVEAEQYDEHFRYPIIGNEADED